MMSNTNQFDSIELTIISGNNVSYSTGKFMKHNVSVASATNLTETVVCQLNAGVTYQLAAVSVSATEKS